MVQDSLLNATADSFLHAHRLYFLPKKVRECKKYMHDAKLRGHMTDMYFALSLICIFFFFGKIRDYSEPYIELNDSTIRHYYNSVMFNLGNQLLLY